MKVKVYLSKQGFDEKPDKSSGMIKTINSYNLVDIELEELYQKLANGHFMHHECGYSESTNGSKCYTFKKQFLKSAQIIAIDFDYTLFMVKKSGEEVRKEYAPNEMPEWSNELLSSLTYTNKLGQTQRIAPTFWIESFSAHKNSPKKIAGNNVHLFYATYDEITNAADYEKTVICILGYLYKALEEKGYNIPLDPDRCPFDPVSADMFQGFWGSSNKNHGYIGEIYFADALRSAYTTELKYTIFKKKQQETEKLTDEDIKRTIEAYSCVETIDDIDINKCQYLKYKSYFGHEEGFHIMSVLKNEYGKIEESVNSKQSLCYQVCKKLLLEHCNDFFGESEDHFWSEYKRCKSYTKKNSTEPAFIEHVVKLIGDTGAIPMIAYKEDKKDDSNAIKLSKTEYLNDKRDKIIEMCKDGAINFIVAQPGLGKTVFAQSLEGKTLIIELFNSIIQSEEKFPSSAFEKFYGSKYIKQESIGKMNVCSANKFVSWCKTDKSSDLSWNFTTKCMFDNIILDESHLLCLSNYRYDIMGETVKYLKKINLDYPDVNIMLMSGTPFGENVVFENLNTINIISDPRYDKKFFMIQTSSIDGYIRELVKSTLSKGMRVFIPVDSENWFDTFIESCVEEGIVAKDKCYYFNQPKNVEEIEQSILNTKLIGDLEILGTSSYMSVGIDLEDWKTKFVTIIPSGASTCGNFSGIEVEQFANRHRKQNLEVHYVISMNESNTKKPYTAMSCKALLNIQNGLLKSIYRTDPIVIHLPKYLLQGDTLEVDEDMFNVFVYYKDMKPIISHPKVIYEYMESIGWHCEWLTLNNTSRGIDTKEHREKEKTMAVKEFMSMLDEWESCGFPMIKLKDSIQQHFEITKHEKDYELFGVEYIEVGFTSYYAKNVLFNMFLGVREYLTGTGTSNLIRDAYSNDKLNMAFIERTMKAIKILSNFNKTGLWDEISTKLSNYYNLYSDVEHAVTSETKKYVECEVNKIIQKIWDGLAEKIDDETLLLAFNSNYGRVTDKLVNDFNEGIKLITTMYLETNTYVKREGKKTVRVTCYKWNEKKLSRYEVKSDKLA